MGWDSRWGVGSLFCYVLYSKKEDGAGVCVSMYIPRSEWESVLLGNVIWMGFYFAMYCTVAGMGVCTVCTLNTMFGMRVCEAVCRSWNVISSIGGCT
jgi:hypothetical protein